MNEWEKNRWKERSLRCWLRSLEVTRHYWFTCFRLVVTANAKGLRWIAERVWNIYLLKKYCSNELCTYKWDIRFDCHISPDAPDGNSEFVVFRCDESTNDSQNNISWNLSRFSTGSAATSGREPGPDCVCYHISQTKMHSKIVWQW